jgi:broad specificity phosphatase PhoE
VDRKYSERDPPLTELGKSQAQALQTTITPGLIVISPMTRKIQTALLAFGSLLSTSPFKTEVQVWPDLREAHDAICNIGVARADLTAKFPQFEFTGCHDKWDYPAHSFSDAEARAERVRRRLKDLSGLYKNIFVVTHRGFIAFLVKGERFGTGGTSTFGHLVSTYLDD